MANKCRLGQTCYVDKNGIDLENKTVPVVLSDESLVTRYSWDDGVYYITLLHGEENVDLSRKDILSLFVNHDTRELPIGRFDNVRIEDKKLKALAMFDAEDEDSMKIFNKLAKGFLQSFSVGIDILDRVLVKEENDVKYYNVTKWSLKEASLVGIPAIPNAKVGMEHISVAIPTAEGDKLAISEKRNSMEFSQENFDKLLSETSNLKAELELVKQEVKDSKIVGQEVLNQAKAEEAKRIQDVSAIIPMTYKNNADVQAKLFDTSVSANDMKAFLFDLSNQDIENEKKKVGEEAKGANGDMLSINDSSSVDNKKDEAHDENLMAYAKQYKGSVK